MSYPAQSPLANKGRASSLGFDVFGLRAIAV